MSRILKDIQHTDNRAGEWQARSNAEWRFKLDCEDKHKNVSLCIECAKHPSLKSFVCSDLKKGVCGVCARPEIEVYDPTKLNKLAMILRALVRFHWDEWLYNPHFGGEHGPEDLLSAKDNPILAAPASEELVDTFFESMFWPPYPPEDEGVAVYAGFSDGIRLLQGAISKTDYGHWHSFEQRLKRENFSEVEPDVEIAVDAILDEISRELPVGSVWYRARLGFNARYDRVSFDYEPDIRFQPYMGTDIGAPPPPQAGAGRLNRSGVAFLYLASDEMTAAAEIRPHPGHRVSMSAFQSTRTLRIADFAPDIAAFSSSDVRLNMFGVIHSIARRMSTPVTPEEKNRYLITQLVAEVLHRRGFDGVRFRSSLSSGFNLCVFRPDTFVPLRDTAKVLQVTALKYEVSEVPTVIDPEPDDDRLKD